jgi:hypothetical protein
LPASPLVSAYPGDGGDGDDASILELDFSPAGTGGSGGPGDTVTPTINFGPFDIRTSSLFGFGLFAQSSGGDGGNGGDNTTIFVGNGGTGGRGGDGGTINLLTTSTGGGILTTGFAGFGVVASSNGGDGGNGGDATAIDAQGGNGGRGGNGGNVTVTVNNFITTFGDHATDLRAEPQRLAAAPAPAAMRRT